MLNDGAAQHLRSIVQQRKCKYCAVEVCAMIHHNPRHRRKEKISAALRANQVCHLSKEKWHQRSVPAVSVPRVGGNHKRRKFEAVCDTVHPGRM